MAARAGPGTTLSGMGALSLGLHSSDPCPRAVDLGSGLTPPIPSGPFAVTALGGNRPVTFLEYVCSELLGPPLRVCGEGEAFWECPWCGSPKFHTRPVSKQFPRQKVACYRCAQWGDAYDLLRHLYP